MERVARVNLGSWNSFEEKIPFLARPRGDWRFATERFPINVRCSDAHNESRVRYDRRPALACGSSGQFRDREVAPHMHPATDDERNRYGGNQSCSSVFVRVSVTLLLNKDRDKRPRPGIMRQEMKTDDAAMQPMEYGRSAEESNDKIEDKNVDEAEIYMNGWKILKIVHMFTRSRIHPEGDKDRTERGRQQWTTSTPGSCNLLKWGRETSCRGRTAVTRNPVQAALTIVAKERLSGGVENPSGEKAWVSTGRRYRFLLPLSRCLSLLLLLSLLSSLVSPSLSFPLPPPT